MRGVVSMRGWLLTPKQVADLLKVTPRTINRWAHDGEIPSITLPSGKFRFRSRDIEDLVGHPELLPQPEEA